MKLLSLDIGCGFLPSHKKRGVIGVDVMRGRCDVVSDACFLPFKDGTFDTIFLLHVLEHLNTPFACLKEAVRVSSSESTLFVHLPEIIHQPYEELGMFVFEFPVGLMGVLKRRRLPPCESLRHKAKIRPKDVIAFLNAFTKIVSYEYMEEPRGVHAWFKGRKGNILRKILRGFEMPSFLMGHKMKVRVRNES